MMRRLLRARLQHTRTFTSKTDTAWRFTVFPQRVD